MTRRTSHPLPMMPPGVQSSEITGFALPWLGVGRAMVLSSRSTTGECS